MRFEFYLPEGYSTKDLITLNRVTGKLFRRGRGIVRIAEGLFGLILLGTSVILLLDPEFPQELLTSTIPPVVMGILLLSLSIWTDRISAWGSRRLLIKGSGAISAVLDESGITECNQKSSQSFPYSSVIALAESRGVYFLYLDRKHALVYPKACCTAGDPEQLGEFLQQACGIPVRGIR